MPYLTPNQARLRDDIRGLIEGEVRCDRLTAQLYATDASILQCCPQAVVWPRHIKDVIACVRYATEKGIPIHARGIGTGTAGESLGPGIVLDFTRSMRRILSLDHESVVVQPGIIRNRLNATLHKVQRRWFGPVSGFSPATTIGSILSRNGAGSNWLRYGKASDHLLEMKVVLANGEVLTLDRGHLPLALETAQEENSRGIALARGIVLGKEHAYADEVYRILTSPDGQANLANPPLPVNRAGYHYYDILKGPQRSHVDLARLITGSEGTLGIIVEAKLKTVSLPCRGAAAVLFFESIEKAARAVHFLSAFKPVLCELFDRRRLNMVLEWAPRFQPLFTVGAEAVLLVELDAGTLADPAETNEVRDRLDRLISTVQEKEKLAGDSLRILTPESFALFDQFIHLSELVLFRMRRSYQPVPLFDDPAVPVATIQPFLLDLLNLLKQQEITTSLSGHLGQGHLRIHPIIDLSKSDTALSLRTLAEEVYSLILQYDGTISSEGGTGLLKSPFVPRQFGHGMTIFRGIKDLFDPGNLFNPGKVFPDGTVWTDRLRRGLANRGMDHPERSDIIGDESGIWESDYRLFSRVEQELANEESDQSEIGEAGSDDSLSSQLELQLKWEPQYIFESTYLCNGCGNCLQFERSNRMCPMFRKSISEEASPRSKANLLRGVLEKELELDVLTSESAKAVADLCLHCQMCSFECPAEVDVSQLAFRCKSAYVAAHGLSLEDLFFSRLDQILKFLTMVSCPVNWSLKNPVTRWIIEKVLQIPQERQLPKLAKVTFLSRAHWSTWLARPPHQNAAKVALFVDTYVNHFDPKLADLAVKILEYNGIGVHVPPRQRASGLMPYAVGSMVRSENLARHNSLLLADLIRQGYHVVALEPASASCITRDYRSLVDDIDTALVTSHVVDFCDFLIQQHRQNKLRLDFKPIRATVGYHAPCRSISITTQQVDAPTPAERLLRLIPELDVRRIEQGCCGMAGLYGLQRKNHRRSVQIGLPLFRELRSEEIDYGVTDCNSCRMQMEHGVKKTIVHPIRLLAASYGIAPELAEMFDVQ